MVPVRVFGVAVDTAMQQIVLLTPLEHTGGPRTLVPIWVGSAEAAAITMALDGEQPTRPLTHDLMQRLVAVLGATVDRVAVTRIEDGTFFAELDLVTADGRITVDCRPSDAIALALRVAAPLQVARSVIDDSGIQEEDEGEPEQAAEDRLAEFRRFLERVEPEDFQG